ncbi:MAG: RNA polymerase sigma factor [Candidatus Cryptobacteroides sp.]
MQVLDKYTFERVIQDYYPKVVGFVSLLHSKADSEDIAQEVFAYLWDKRLTLTFNDERFLFAWLIRVAKSKSFDVFRKKGSPAKFRV